MSPLLSMVTMLVFTLVIGAVVFGGTTLAYVLERHAASTPADRAGHTAQGPAPVSGSRVNADHALDRAA